MSDAGGSEGKTDREKKQSDGELNDPPAEPSVRSAQREMQPAVCRVDEHHPDPHSEPGEDFTGLCPLGAQDQQDDIPAREGEKRAQGHADEGKV
jgi:hypothetical protein